MQIWLEPISELFSTTHAMCAALTRMGYALDKANISSDSVHQLAQLSARLFPGNLQAYAGNLDSSAYAAEVIRQERDRVDFPRHLRHELDQIKSQLGQSDIEWCLPILEPELFITDTANFAHQMLGQNWVSIYLVTDVDLFDHMFPRNKNIIRLTEAQFKAMQITPGIPPSLHSTLPLWSPPAINIPAPNPRTQSSLDDDLWGDEKTLETVKPKKPSHRSIYDESTPSW